MAKKQKSKKNLLRKFKAKTQKSLPAVKKGLTKIGSNVSTAAKSSAPALKKGMGTIFDTMAAGIEKGINKLKTLGK